MEKLIYLLPNYIRMKKILGLFILLFLVTACETEQVIKDKVNILIAKDNRSISTNLKIANFNIQVFGQSKLADTQTMNTIYKILSEYDFVAIEEIRDSEGAVAPTLLANLHNKPYSLITSPRLGRTTSKEQYIMLYNEAKLKYIDSYVFGDSEDTFEREPFVAKFKRGDTSLIFIQIHTKPTDTKKEIDKLSDVYLQAKKRYQNDTNFIILGDLNADCDYYKPEDKIIDLPELIWVTLDTADTTTKTTDCAYDRILVSGDLENKVKDFGVDRIDKTYNLNEESLYKISDHFPVYITLE